jgi:hypothetical protein
MTETSDRTCFTDLDDHEANTTLISRGYTIRHIETWHRDGHSDSVIAWDPPEITEADLPN